MPRQVFRFRRPLNYRIGGNRLAAFEWKAVDVTNTTAIDNAGAVILLNGIARGDDINERNARQVLLRSIQFTMYGYSTDATGEEQAHRVLLVFDRQSNAAALTAANVLVSNNVVAPRNLENRHRFKILMDRKVSCSSRIVGGGGRDAGHSYFIEFYRKLRHPMTFNNGDAGTIADIISGSIYMIVVGTEAAGGTAGSGTYFSRIRYTDS